MKTIWLVYPYGDIVGEKFMEARHIRFGRMLAENGYRVIYWTANYSHTFKRWRSKGRKTINVCPNFDIELVPTSPYKKNISIGRLLFEINYSKSLAKIFKDRETPDLILTAGTGLVTAFHPIWPYMKETGVPVIYDIMDVHLFNSYMETHHKALIPFAKALTRNIEKREKGFYENVAAVCGLGKNQLEIAKKRTGRDDIPSCLVYNSIFVDDFRRKMDLPCDIKLPEKKEGWIWCIYAGSLGPSYDIEPLLNCAKEAQQKSDKIRFIIAGAGPQEDLVADVAAKSDNVTFLGPVSIDALPSIYKKCDIGLSTYASYSTVDMPDKFYDYTAAGLAIVNSLRGEIRDYVVEGRAGVQYEPENSHSMYDSIKVVISDLDNYKGASYRLAERFDLAYLMKPLLEMIDNLIS